MLSIASLRRRLSGLYYGWRMIGLTALIRTIGGGLHSFGFTVYFLPIQKELGISNAATSLAFSLARAEGAIEGPLAGYLIDRFGPKPVILTAALMCGTGYLLFSTVESYASFLIIYVGVISLTFTAGFVHAPAVLAVNWFVRYRARALTCLSAAMPVGGTVITFLLVVTVHFWGWRTAAALAGCGLLFVAAPLALKIRRSPESMGLQLDTGTASSPAPPPGTGEDGSRNHGTEPHGESDYELGRAMRTPVYWLFVLWMTTRSAAYTIVLVYFIPLMEWKGLTFLGAGMVLSWFNFMNIVAHFIMGWIADQTNKMRLVAWCMVLSLVATLILMWSDTVWGLLLFAALFTVLDASIPVIWAAVGDYFGRRRFGTIRGNMSFFYMWGSVLGPYLAGTIVDRFNSHTYVLWLLLGLVGAAGVTTALLIGPWTRGVARRD